MNQLFLNRTEAGKRLAEKLKQYADEDVIIYGLPRGGAVVAREVADELNSPLSLIIVRKIGHPANPEYGIGAITDDGHIAVSEAAVSYLGQDWFEEEAEKQRKEALRRKELYKIPEIETKGKIAIIIDDGLATGMTMLAAIKSLKEKGVKKIIAAVPVSPEDTAELIKKEVDELIVLATPEPFGAVGMHYKDFAQISDEDVVKIIKYAGRK